MVSIGLAGITTLPDGVFIPILAFMAAAALVVAAVAAATDRRFFSAYHYHHNTYALYIYIL